MRQDVDELRERAHDDAAAAAATTTTTAADEETLEGLRLVLEELVELKEATTSLLEGNIFDNRRATLEQVSDMDTMLLYLFNQVSRVMDRLQLHEARAPAASADVHQLLFRVNLALKEEVARIQEMQKVMDEQRREIEQSDARLRECKRANATLKDDLEEVRGELARARDRLNFRLEQVRLVSGMAQEGERRERELQGKIEALTRERDEERRKAARAAEQVERELQGKIEALTRERSEERRKAARAAEQVEELKELLAMEVLARAAAAEQPIPAPVRAPRRPPSPPPPVPPPQAPVAAPAFAAPAPARPRTPPAAPVPAAAAPAPARPRAEERWMAPPQPPVARRPAAPSRPQAFAFAPRTLGLALT
jgi:hypothetical protein